MSGSGISGRFFASDCHDTITLNPPNRQALRRHYRSLRQQLSPQQQDKAAKDLLRQFTRAGLQLKHKHVALYLANDGEINPARIFGLLRKLKRHCYLPVLHPVREGHLLFCRADPSTRYRRNRFGIKEPCLSPEKRIPTRLLSLVLLPLVAFDLKGNRLGMGGGFYDRSFAFKTARTGGPPKMIGLAHECQKAEQLPAASWDMPLDAILTDRGFYTTT